MMVFGSQTLFAGTQGREIPRPPTRTKNKKPHHPFSACMSIHTSRGKGGCMFITSCLVGRVFGFGFSKFSTDFGPPRSSLKSSQLTSEEEGVANLSQPASQPIDRSVSFFSVELFVPLLPRCCRLCRRLGCAQEQQRVV